MRHSCSRLCAELRTPNGLLKTGSFLSQPACRFPIARQSVAIRRHALTNLFDIPVAQFAKRIDFARRVVRRTSAPSTKRQNLRSGDRRMGWSNTSADSFERDSQTGSSFRFQAEFVPVVVKTSAEMRDNELRISDSACIPSENPA